MRSVPDAVLPVSEPRASVENHLLALTGLRILPALVVYFSHFSAPAGSPEWLSRALASGYYGVTVFFVLSGFVLTINYWDALTRPSGRVLWSYAVARFARIYPLYLAVIAYLVARQHVSAGTYPHSLPWHVFGLNAWLPNVFDAVAFGPSWSISVELFLYAALPLLVLGLRPLVSVRRLVVAAFVTIAAMLLLAWWFQHTGRADFVPDPAAPGHSIRNVDSGSAHRWLYRTPVTRLGDFMLGIFAARLYLKLRGRPRAEPVGAACAVAGIAGLVFFSTQSWMFHSAFGWDVGYAVPSTLLIVGLALSPRAVLSRLLALPAFVLLGEASYAFYLIHTTVAVPFGAGSWAARVTAGTLGLEALALGLVLAVAIGLHIGLERPARVFLRRLLDRRRTPPAAARTPVLLHYG